MSIKYNITFFFFLRIVGANAQEIKTELNDLRKEGVKTDIWDWKFEGKELNKVYVDKILWAYQPTSEHPYTGIAYRMQFFKQEKRGIINYQIVNGQEEDFDTATYKWENDSVAVVMLYNTKTKKTGGAKLTMGQMGGGIPADYVEEKK